MTLLLDINIKVFKSKPFVLDHTFSRFIDFIADSIALTTPPIEVVTYKNTNSGFKQVRNASRQGFKLELHKASTHSIRLVNS